MDASTQANIIPSSELGGGFRKRSVSNVPSLSPSSSTAIITATNPSNTPKISPVGAPSPLNLDLVQSDEILEIRALTSELTETREKLTFYTNSFNEERRNLSTTKSEVRFNI